MVAQNIIIHGLSIVNHPAIGDPPFMEIWKSPVFSERYPGVLTGRCGKTHGETRLENDRLLMVGFPQLR
jgi:hypothetical protein